LILFHHYYSGDGCVGKSALAVRFTYNHFIEDDPTFDESFRKRVTVDGIPHMVEIIDTCTFKNKHQHKEDRHTSSLQ